MILVVGPGRFIGDKERFLVPQIHFFLLFLVEWAGTHSTEDAHLVPGFIHRTVAVNPFGNLESLDRASYRTLMLFNATAFGRALGVEEEEDKDKNAPISAIPDSPDAP